MAKVLLLDDEMTLVQMIGEVLRGEGHQITPFTNSRSALDALPTVAPDLVIAHGEQSRVWGAGLLQKARSVNPPALVLMITGSGSADAALEAVKRGAYDYLPKPFTIDELKLRMRRALSYHAALSENLTLRQQLQSKTHFQEIIGSSARMQEVRSVAEGMAESDASLFVCGGRGTGKELLARAVHANGRRRFAPFVVVNCQLPENLLEPELFGQKKAAFANPASEQPGLLHAAEGGTLFLDHVGSLSIALQARLENVLGSGTSTRDLRLISSNRDPLDAQLATGNFVRELFARLTEVSIAMPCLQERVDDIPQLIAHFLEGKIHARTGKPFQISREAVDTCRSYPWPGNVQELQSALEQARLVCEDGNIQCGDLPRNVQQLAPATEHPLHLTAPNGNSLFMVRASKSSFRWPETTDRLDAAPGMEELVPLKRFLRDQEVSYLQRILNRVGGSKEKAAELLGISLATIYRKLAEPSSTSDCGEPQTVGAEQS